MVGGTLHLAPQVTETRPRLSLSASSCLASLALRTRTLWGHIRSDSLGLVLTGNHDFNLTSLHLPFRK